jgi:homoserine O-acetyltransferase/O-succinyltransferase
MPHVRYLAAFLCLIGGMAAASELPAPREGQVILRNFAFTSGGTLPELRIHYRMLGEPRRDAGGVVRNAVLIVHGTTGSGLQFLRREFAGELFGPGQPLDVSQYCIVLLDEIGHGRSSKPSNGLRAQFPRYGFRDMIEADYRVLRELGINHLRLVIGTSMGGMHVWLWGGMYPEFVDALMPLGSLPIQVSGRNRVWRRMISDAIRQDPAWDGGNYTEQPPSLRLVAQVLYFMTSNPVLRQREGPTLARTDAVLDAFVENFMKGADANDLLYAIEASHDYDPGPLLERIRAPLVAINTADDLINPPELGVLEREIKRVPRGRAVVLPWSPELRGHGSHTVPRLWKHEVIALLRESER